MKEEKKEKLQRTIWAIADDLRGAVDGWDFKNYVLGTMFYRYISENLTNYINEDEAKAGNPDFDYAAMSDADAEEAREEMVKSKGFFILPSELFWNVVKSAPNDENLNMTLETIFRHIEESAQGSESESSFAGLFDDFDVNSKNLGFTVAKRNEKLVMLLNGVAAMDLGDVKHHDIDAFGDAYEYLMDLYCRNNRIHCCGEYTPDDVSELLVRLASVGKTEIDKIYDPACGFGTLLLKAEKLLGGKAIRNGLWGQEIDSTTYNLCRMNMFLHSLDYDEFNISCGDTLTSPQHWNDQPFDLIISNSPFALQWAGNSDPQLIDDPRYFPAGVLAPNSSADLAFIMHSLYLLSPHGTAAILMNPMALFRGGAEQKIRKYLVDNNFIDCIIQLPSNLFYNTAIAPCIMILKKNKTDNKILFIDARKQCIQYLTKREKRQLDETNLAPENIGRIVFAFKVRMVWPNFSYLASYEDVVKKDYNLSALNYVVMRDYSLTASCYKVEKDNNLPESHYKNEEAPWEEVNIDKFLNSLFDNVIESTDKMIVIRNGIMADDKPRSYRGEKPYIFISYSHRDENQVIEIIQKLQEHGFRVFYDEGISSGQKWNDYLADRIANCSCFCAMFSEQYFASEPCQCELLYAQQINKKHFCVYLQEVAEIPRGIQMSTIRTQNINLYDYKDQNNFLERLYSTELMTICRRDPSEPDEDE